MEMFQHNLYTAEKPHGHLLQPSLQSGKITHFAFVKENRGSQYVTFNGDDVLLYQKFVIQFSTCIVFKHAI